MQKFKFIDHFKTRERVRDLGEVFTPEHYVEEMLDVIGKQNASIWEDPTTSFFEPSCGPGNIVVAIFRRRLRAIHAKTIAAKKEFGLQYTVANALNSLWAVDIDPENVLVCKDRVLSEIMNFIMRNSECMDFWEFVSQNRKFTAHLLCAINWQILVNEVTSALATADDAERVANLTKTATEWFSTQGHHPLDLHNTWVSYFSICQKGGTIPILFQNAMQHLELALSSQGQIKYALSAQSIFADLKTDKRNSAIQIAG